MPSPPKAILLVEDDANDEALTLRVLRKSRVANEVIVVRDGAMALEYLSGTGHFDGRDIRDTPSVVLLDLKLPRIDGLEVLRHIRSDPRTKLLPVVILTSSREEQDRLAGYRDGANSFVVKPVDFAQFAEAVQQLALYWLVLNEEPPAPRKAPS